jgi:hypothetical protein
MGARHLTIQIAKGFTFCSTQISASLCVICVNYARKKSLNAEDTAIRRLRFQKCHAAGAKGAMKCAPGRATVDGWRSW